MLKLTIAVALAVAGLAAPVLAETSDGSPAQARPKPAKAPKVCRETTSSTSRIGAGKICRTEAEWAEIDAKGSDRNGRAVRSVGPEGGQ